MKQKWIPLLAAVLCVWFAAAGADAAQGPVLSGKSEADAAVKLVNYKPDGKQGYILYGAGQVRVNADNGGVYRLVDCGALSDPERFRAGAPKVTVVDPDVKRIKPEPLAGREGVGLAVEMERLATPVATEFTVAYTSLADQELAARPSGKNDRVSLTVKKGASVTARYKLSVSDETLERARYAAHIDPPKWSGDVLLEKDPRYPAGIDRLLLEPVRDGGNADIQWGEDEEMTAWLDFGGAPAFTPKLSTDAPDARLGKEYAFGTLYVRSFKNHPAIENGTATLTLINPFLNVEREETVPHGQLYLYESDGGKLADASSRFRYAAVADADGREYGAFVGEVKSLGCYVISSVKLV